MVVTLGATQRDAEHGVAEIPDAGLGIVAAGPGGVRILFAIERMEAIEGGGEKAAGIVESRSPASWAVRNWS